MDKSILIVEDDKDLLEALVTTFQNEKFHTVKASNVNSALSLIKSNAFTLILSDINLNNSNGMDLLEKMKIQNIRTPIIMMTAYGKISDAVKSIQLGAFDYIVKPFSSEQLLHKIEKIGKQQNVNKNLISNDERTKKCVLLADQVAQSDASVLITGESGSGKEVFAQYIHQKSNRTGEFVAINCAAIPENMLEAILFGYEKGAFTGAYQTTAGKMEHANNGTLLLDEITEMPLSLQAKLLRVIQEREVERIGSNKTVKINVRIIATTNRNLTDEINKGTFRQDLYFRLHVFPLHVPPLRERKNDIVPLANHFFKKISDNKNYLMNASAELKLKTYHWPGNIRELQNVIHRAMIISNTDTIDADHIIFDIGETHSTTLSSSGTLTESRINQENELILKTLKLCDGNREMCASHLGVSPRTLRYKIARMKKMGVLI